MNKSELQKILAEASKTGRKVLIEGSHTLDRTLHVWSNTTVEWASGALLIAAENYKSGYMIRFDNQENITFINPQLDGNKEKNSSGKALGIHGFGGAGASRIQIMGGHIRNMPRTRRTDPSGKLVADRGDGIYIGGKSRSDYWRIWGLEASGCERNGVSVTNCRFSVFEGIIACNNQHAGIDIEPDHSHQRAVGLVVRNCILNKNAFGLIALSRKNPGLGHISIMGNSIEENEIHGILIDSFAPSTIIGNIIRNNAQGIKIISSGATTVIGNVLSGQEVPIQHTGTSVILSANNM